MLAVIIFLSVYFVNVIAMSEEDYITAKEDACFEWIHSLKDQCTLAFNDLDQQAQTALNSNDDSLKRNIVLYQYAINILRIVKQEKIPIPNRHYNSSFVASVLRKVKKAMTSSETQEPVGPTTARLYAYKLMLTQEDHLLLKENNYIVNPSAGDAVLVKYAYNVVSLIQRYDNKNRYGQYYKNIEKAVNKIVQEKRESILKLYGLK